MITTLLREDMDEGTSEVSNYNGNVSDDKEDKDYNLSDGEFGRSHYHQTKLTMKERDT